MERALFARASEGLGQLGLDDVRRTEATTALERRLTEPEHVLDRPAIAALVEAADWTGLLDAFGAPLPRGPRSRPIVLAAEDARARLDALLTELAARPPRRLGGRRVHEATLRGGRVLTIALEGDARVDIVLRGALGEVTVTLPPPPPDDGDELHRRRDEATAEGLAAGLLGDTLRIALERLGLYLPPHALALSDLLPAEWKAHFAGHFLPELDVHVQELQRGLVEEDAVRTWIAEGLAGYGPDAGALLERGFRAYVQGLRGVVGERGAPTLALMERLFPASTTRPTCLPSFFERTERSEATPRGRGGAMEAEPD